MQLELIFVCFFVSLFVFEIHPSLISKFFGMVLQGSFPKYFFSVLKFHISVQLASNLFCLFILSNSLPFTNTDKWHNYPKIFTIFLNLVMTFPFCLLFYNFFKLLNLNKSKKSWSLVILLNTTNKTECLLPTNTISFSSIAILKQK